MPRKVTITHTAHMHGHTGHTDGVEGNSLATLKTRGQGPSLGVAGGGGGSYNLGGNGGVWCTRK